MCQQVLQFCSSSAKPLVFAGGCLTLLLAGAIAYMGHAVNSLYQDLDPKVAAGHSLGYFLQLAAAIYLLLVTVFSCLAAHYDHKQSIRALAIVTSINFVLAAVAILMLPTSQQVGQLFAPRLKEAQKIYDYTDKLASADELHSDSLALNMRSPRATLLAESAAAAASGSPSQQMVAAAQVSGDSPQAAPAAAAPLDKAEATRLWDRLQLRGCCGIHNSTEWNPLPKSCCNQDNRLVDGDKVTCKTTDLSHEKCCLSIIESSNCNLMIVLGLIALVNLYLATVSGVNAYRTFHYNEASQSQHPRRWGGRRQMEPVSRPLVWLEAKRIKGRRRLGNININSIDRQTGNLATRVDSLRINQATNIVNIYRYI